MKLDKDSNLVELTIEDAYHINGGSELSEAVFYTLGLICRFTIETSKHLKQDSRFGDANIYK